MDWSLGNWRRSQATLQHLRHYIRVGTTLPLSPGCGAAGSPEAQSAALRRFLKFITGSPNLPYGGLASLPPPSGKIVFTRLPRSERLPEAHTCFNTVDLPDYGDFATLCEKFNTAIGEDDGVFGLL